MDVKATYEGVFLEVSGAVLDSDGKEIGKVRGRMPVEHIAIRDDGSVELLSDNSPPKAAE